MAPQSREGNDNAGEDKGSSNLRWTNEMDKVLVQALVDQLSLGNKKENGWTSTAYAQVKRKMQNQLGITLVSGHIRNRLKTWRTHYVTITKCLKHGGFRWDDVAHVLRAPNSVWTAYLKKNPKAVTCRMKCIPYFKDICRIMGDEEVTPNKTGHENIAGEKDEGSQIGDGSEDNPNEDYLANGHELDNLNSSDTEKPASSSSIPTQQLVIRAKRKRSEELEEVGIVEVMGSLAEGIKRIASAMEDKKPINLNRIVEELSKIPDFSEDLIIRASEFLACDDRLGRLFFALSADQRKYWIMKRLEAGN